MADGDRERNSDPFREKPEPRILTLEATLTEALSDEALTELTDAVEVILRSMGDLAMKARVSCQQEVTEDGGLLRIQSDLFGKEGPLQGLAANAFAVFSQMPDIKLPSWHISTPPSMRKAWEESGTIRP